MGQFFSDKTEEAIELLFKHYEQDKMKLASELLTEAAKEGDADAYYFLSRCFLGQQYIWKYSGFEDDEKKSTELLKKSIEMGSACGVLGGMRTTGISNATVHRIMTFDTIKEAFDIVLQKAEAGHPFCQYMIGNTYYWDDVYEIEHFTPEKYDKIKPEYMKKAEDWFLKAVHQGYAFFSKNLLLMYQNGEEGFAPDAKKYAELLKYCANIGHPGFEAEYADYLYDNNQYKESLRYFESSVNKGNLDAWADIGYMYDNGQGVAKDASYAVSCYIKGAEVGRLLAQTQLGLSYYYGVGTDVNYGRAYYWLDMAASRDDKQAFPVLGMCYLKGLGVEQDPVAAKLLFEECENKSTSLTGLGLIYVDGLGVPEDINKGINYLKRAEQLGSEDAPMHISRFKKGLLGKWKRR